jgi:hypothetical protein
MDVIFTHGAGLDVHQKTVMACRLTPDPAERQADGIMELKEFGLLRDFGDCGTASCRGWFRASLYLSHRSITHTYLAVG